MRSTRWGGMALAAIGFVTCLAGSARAAEWKVASGNFDNPANWTAAYYGGGIEDWVQNGGTAYVITDMSARQPRTVWVHAGSTVDVQSGGILAPYEGFYLGRNAGTGTVIVEPGGKVQGGGGFSLGYSAGTGNQIVTLKAGGTIVLNTFVGDNGQGTLNVQGGTLQSSQYGNVVVGYHSGSNGLVIQDGGSVSCDRAAFVGLAGTGTYYLNGGTFSPSAADSSRVFGIGGSHDGDNWGQTGGNGTFIQTGGTFSGGYMTIGDYTGTGLYRISGGTFTSGKLTIGWDTGGTNTQYGTGTLEINGSGPVSIAVNGPLKLGPNATLAYKLDGGGVDAVGVQASTTVALGGALNVSLKNGAALLTNTSYNLMTYGSGQVSGAFATQNTSVFTTAQGATAYTAALTPAQKDFAPNLTVAAQEQTFAAGSSGWFGIDTTGLSGGMFTLYLGVNGSTTEKNSLLAAMQAAGYYAAPMSYGIYNVQLGLPLPTPGPMGYFAYDLAGLGAGLQVFAAQLPEPGALALLALGGVGLLRRRRR